MSKELFELLYNEIVARGSGVRTTIISIWLKTQGYVVETETQYVAMHDEYVELTAVTRSDYGATRMYIPYDNVSHLAWTSRE